MKFKIAVLLAIFAFASCSVKKRTYRDGYYIDWAFHKKKGNVKSANLSSKNEHIPTKEVKETEYVVATKDIRANNELFSKPKEKTSLIDTCGDIITFKSGDQVIARVSEITEDKIKYKRCDNLGGPDFVVNKKTVQSVKYANGVVETIQAPIENSYPSNNNNKGNEGAYTPPPKTHPLAIAGLIALILSIVTAGITLIVSFVLAIIAKNKIKNDPKKYKGANLAEAVFVISLVLLSIAVAILLLILLVYVLFNL